MEHCKIITKLEDKKALKDASERKRMKIDFKLEGFKRSRMHSGVISLPSKENLEQPASHF